ncbi:MAG: phosphohydrolase, partial [Caldisericia bacterium]|nr:phosphohydrolase [Caldisericia bacterium]
KGLYAVDPLTGLIIASALMTPEKSLLTVRPQTVLKRFKEKRFAAGANREQIAMCSQLGLSLEDFCQVCLTAMQSIHETLGI